MNYYSLEYLQQAYRHENPTLSEIEIEAKAKQLHSTLNTLDIQWKRSNRKFYRRVQLEGFLTARYRE